MRVGLTTSLRFGVVLGMCAFVIPPLVDWDMTQLTHQSSRLIAFKLSYVIFGAVVAGLVATRTRRRTLAQDSSTAARHLAKEWETLVQPGWWRKVLLQGVLLSAGVGMPVGLLVAVKMPTAELPSGGRVAMFFAFLGLTAAWAIPMAFFIRRVTLTSYRRILGRAGTLRPESS